MNKQEIVIQLTDGQLVDRVDGHHALHPIVPHVQHIEKLLTQDQNSPTLSQLGVHLHDLGVEHQFFVVILTKQVLNDGTVFVESVETVGFAELME